MAIGLRRVVLVGRDAARIGRAELPAPMQDAERGAVERVERIAGIGARLDPLRPRGRDDLGRALAAAAPARVALAIRHPRPSAAVVCNPHPLLRSNV